MAIKRVACLYRVSTKNQLLHDDSLAKPTYSKQNAEKLYDITKKLLSL